jgi:hypothetical protein
LVVDPRAARSAGFEAEISSVIALDLPMTSQVERRVLATARRRDRATRSGRVVELELVSAEAAGLASISARIAET